MTVSGWRELPSERIALYSPIGLRLIDDFTGSAPLGRVSVALEVEIAPGVWGASDLEAVRTPSNVLIWPGLGREFEPASATTRRYRVRVSAELYRPSYLQNADGVEFLAPPWDDSNPPAPLPPGAQELYLFPATAYDFPTWVRVLRGSVEDLGGAPVPNVVIQQVGSEQTLTDERGTFALPLRWASSGQSVDAFDLRTGRTGTHLLTLPADLLSNITITIV